MEGMGRNDTAPSRNPELVSGSRSRGATDGGRSFAGGMADDRCAICSIRILQTFTDGCGGVMVPVAD